ncbi:MAG: GatB/YqeY domain-containing protein [Bacteroidetes bacterium]|nr:GatB/YqeY domain-containing protein [Bacteroidota bacterium]
MNLTDKINGDIKAAMLAREKEKLEALRAVKSAILLFNTQDGSKKEITEEDEIKLLQKMVKQRKETAEIYIAQNRQDLAQNELFQAEVIEKYLPEQMPPDQIRSIIQQIIKETGAASVRDMGKVMNAAAASLAGKADNKTIAGFVKELLGN